MIHPDNREYGPGRPSLWTVVIAVVGVLLIGFVGMLVQGCAAAAALGGAYGALTSTVSLAQRNEQLNVADAQADELKKIREGLERRGWITKPLPLSTSETAREYELKDRAPKRKTFWTRLWELL